MKLKLDDQSHAVLLDGKPVYVHTDGSESPFDVVATIASIGSRTAQSARVEAENKELKDRLKTFDGISDPAEALKAVETVKNYDSSKNKDAAEWERRLGEASKTFKEQIDVEKARGDSLHRKLDERIISEAFASSKFIAEKLAVPADMVRATFGKHFKVENDTLIAVDGNGNTIASKANPVSNASFDEAFEILVGGYAHKDSILKANNASGSGAPANGGNGKPGSKTMQRSTFDALDPMEKAATIKSGTQIHD